MVVYARRYNYKFYNMQNYRFQGSYATVHLAEYIDGASSKKMRLACKIFDKEKAPHDFLDKFFPRELEILTKIENPHIIQVRVIRKMLISLSVSDW